MKLEKQLKEQKKTNEFTNLRYEEKIMTASNARIAAAPISWGVCEVPGWGHQMSPNRVLSLIVSINEITISCKYFQIVSRVLSVRFVLHKYLKLTPGKKSVL